MNSILYIIGHGLLGFFIFFSIVTLCLLIGWAWEKAVDVYKANKKETYDITFRLTRSFVETNEHIHRPFVELSFDRERRFIKATNQFKAVAKLMELLHETDILIEDVSLVKTID